MFWVERKRNSITCPVQGKVCLMPFSWEKAKKQAIDIKIRRAITMARAGTNDDFKILHPDWVRDAQSGKFIDLKLKVKQKVEKTQELAIKRREKIAGK